MKLTDLSMKQTAVIQRIGLSFQDRQRLYYLGFYPGAVIEKNCVAPMHDPIVYRIHGALYVLRNEEAKQIEVEVKI